MALCAVVQEQALTHADSLGILGDFLDRHGGVLGEQRFDLGTTALHFLLVLARRTPLQGAIEATQARVQDQIAHRKHDGEPEQAYPPARQRVVDFAQVSVPDVTGGLVFGGGSLGIGTEQKHCNTEHDAKNDNRNHIQ